jgi:biopolymer transport protein ExbD
MKKRDAFCEINITPLTDIFLVLLIIMMVIAPLLDQQGLNLAVPQRVESKTDEQPKTLDINVSKDGIYTIADKEVSAEQLLFEIKDKSKEFKDGVLIKADDDSTHGAVVKVMDAARNAGVKNVSLVEI